jgi:hypothetical protein
VSGCNCENLPESEQPCSACVYTGESGRKHERGPITMSDKPTPESVREAMKDAHFCCQSCDVVALHIQADRVLRWLYDELDRHNIDEATSSDAIFVLHVVAHAMRCAEELYGKDDA